MQFRRLDLWARDTAVRFRRNAIPTRLPREARIGIRGGAMKVRGVPAAVVMSRSQIGYWMETGTGIYGPHRKPIRSKGGEYTDALGRRRKRRALRIETAGGFIFRTSVAGMKARPWFFKGISGRLAFLREQLREDYQKAFNALSARARR